MLAVHCDLDKTERFYAGLYRDMIRLLSLATDLYFTGDGVTFAGTPGAPARPAPDELAPRTPARVLVAFGDSFTYGVLPNPGDAGSSLGAAALAAGRPLAWKTPYLGHEIRGAYPVEDALAGLLRNECIAVASGRAEP